ncbi:VWA domain-containing protein [Kutzneria sp. CA-103260]|uniref:VWA domain-containing protein n=1 Tax=Kutzneria sp. CA-103260 TaxID=2802641 RepID=UPI0020121F35|nr:VWA domain-containing protein [Kutzneria sp. CA-103260]
MTVSEFSLEVGQNRFLSRVDTHMHAVLKVRARDVDGPAVRPSAEVLVVDCSSSMDWPPTKIANARKAAAAAVDALPDGTWFALVEGTDEATMRYPDTPRLVPADARTRQRAKAAAGHLVAIGATAMSTWLSLARDLLDTRPDAVRHALLLTDGRNESEPASVLHRVLDECEGRFTCDARGIGDDWEPEDLRRIAGVLRGTADAVVEDADLPAEFRRLIRSATDKAVPDLRLRLVTPAFARLESIRQVAPADIDLTDRVVAVKPGVVEVSTGAWGEEAREFFLTLAVDMRGRPRFEDLQLGRVELVPPDASVRVPAAPTPILGHLTEDVRLSTRIDEDVERYTVQADLGQRLKAGWVRFGEDDHQGAVAEWGEAVRLATQLGNTEILRRLGRLVDIDPDSGEVTLKDDIRPRDGFAAVLSLASAATSDTPVTPEAVPGGQPRQCPDCPELSPPDAQFCMHCGHRFEVAP